MEGELEQWLARTKRPRGAVVTPQVLYDLGRDWYKTRLDVDWEPATAAQATAMFARHGLTGEFWVLPDGQSRSGAQDA